MAEYRVLVAHEGFRVGKIVVSDSKRSENLAKGGYLRKLEVTPNGDEHDRTDTGGDAPVTPRPGRKKVADVADRPEPVQRATGGPIRRSQSDSARSGHDAVRVEEDGPTEPGTPVGVEGS